MNAVLHMHRSYIPLILPCVLIAAIGRPLEASDSEMRQSLEQRVAQDPEDATSWRLLGHYFLKNGEFKTAIRVLKTAVELDPSSGAARFDLGSAFRETGDLEGAAEQWQAVLELAPDSVYADSAEENLADLSAPDGVEVKTIGYQIQEYPGPPRIDALDERPGELADEPSKRIPVFLRFETGLLYNSNVALAPSSRQLPPGDRQSFQLFASPEIEWWAMSKGNWVFGPLFTGYFTVNEQNFDSFNLSSFAPGLFAEATWDQDPGSPTLRLEYRYGVDEFGGQAFSKKHSVFGRMTVLQTDDIATTGYLAADQTNFADDGVLPEVTSADGTTYAAGLSREFLLDDPWCRQLRIGIDLDRLDATGSDFAYWGAGVSGQTVVSLMPTVDLTLRGGVGYRMFDRYEFEPDRDELIYRVGCEARKWFTPQLSGAATFAYQVFDSNNPLFAADRMIAGITLRYEY